MARCPACNHDVATPFFLNLDGWRWLVCPHCKARLDMRLPWSAALGPLLAPMFVLARQGHVFAIVAYIFACVIILLLLLESLRPKVQLRKKPLPKPTIRLNIHGPLN